MRSLAAKLAKRARKILSVFLVFILLPITAIQVLVAPSAHAAAPGAPTITKIEYISNRQAKIYFTAPASDGGSTITNYKYSTDLTNANPWKLRTDGTGISSPIVVTQRSTNNGALPSGSTTFTICAVNADQSTLGTCASPSNSKAAIQGTPNAPTGLSITSADSSLNVSFTAPTSNGGSTITNYAYSTDGTTFTALSPTDSTSPITITGLTNGTAYTIYIAAINANGTGTPSLPATGTPIGPPGAPGSVSASSGDTIVNLTWTAPSTNGGAAITGYKIEKSTDNSNWTVVISDTGSTTLSYRVTSLTNGISYFFRVSALNSYGAGATTATNSSTPSGVPSAPTITGVSTPAGTSQIIITFSDPSSNGGSTISNYEYTTNGGAATPTWVTRTDSGGTSNSLTISKLSTDTATVLTIGTTYQVMIRAVNSVGSGNKSNLVNATPPAAATTPAAPTITSIVPGNTNLSVYFSAGSDGGATITNYAYSLNGGSFTALATPSTSSPITISSLTNGTIYSVTIKAINSVNASNLTLGTASAAVSGTPATTPGAPTAISGTTGISGTVNLTWTAPASNGGSSITGYFIEYQPSGGSWTTAVADTGNSSTLYSVTGLTNGTTYSFRIKAINVMGSGATGNAANTYVPASVPDAPTITGINTGNATLTVNITAGGSNGSAITNYWYSTDNGANFIARNDGATTSTSLTINTLSDGSGGALVNGTSYSVIVEAINSVGTGALSNMVSATPSAFVISGGGNVNVNYGSSTTSTTFTTSGGTGSVSWTVKKTSDGKTVSGITISAGVISVSNSTTSGTYSMTVTATDSSGTPKNATAAVTITVNKLTPTLNSWSDVTKTFGDASYNVTAPTVTNSVLGTFTYSSSNNSVISVSGTTFTVAGAGTSTITATFTPTDSANYETISTTMVTTVNVATLAAPTGISVAATSGAGGSLTITFTANSNATSTTYFVYSALTGGSSIATGTITTGGTITGLTNGTIYYVTLKSVGSGNYATGSESTPRVSGTPSRGDPSISAFTVPALTYYTAATLSATSSVAGAFTFNVGGSAITGCSSVATNGSNTSTCSYTPTVTSSLTFTVDFAPTDSTNYNSLSAQNSTSSTPSKVALVVTPNAQSVNYGDSAPTYTFAVTGFVNSENAGTAASYVAPSCTSTYSNITAVSSSPVSISCSGGSATNYSFTTTATASLTITAATLANASFVSVDATAATAKSITAQWNSIANADSYTLKIYNSDGSSLLYTITGASGTSIVINSSNYPSISGGATYKISISAIGSSNFASSSESNKVSVTATAEAGAPTISGISPTYGSASGGTSVLITGTNFTGATKVEFDTTAATSFVVDSSTQITAVAPAGTGVAHIVVTTTSSVSLDDSFTYVSPPSVSGLSVSTGINSGGTSVVITGTNFNHVSAVYFGASSATYAVNSDTQITATSPSHSNGTVHVTIVNSTATSATSSADQFQFKNANAITVTSAPTSVTFGAAAGAYSVVATASSSSVTYSSLTSSVCTVASDGKLTILAAGTCQIAADSLSTTDYLAAPQVTESITVEALALDLPTSFGAVTSGSTPTSAVVNFASVANANKYQAKVYDDTGALVQTIENFTSGATVTGLDGSKTYQISIKAQGVGNYKDSTESTKISVKSQWTSLASVTSNKHKVAGFNSSNLSSQTTSLATAHGSFSAVLPAGALDPTTPIEIWELSDMTNASAYLPNLSYVSSLAVAWQAADGTSANLTHPIAMTVNDSSIKVGSHVYLLIGSTYTDVGTATQDGTVTFNITSDPGIFISAAPAITPATQTVNATVGAAITSTTAYTATNFDGTVTYAISGGTLPTGLNFSTSTGVLSGTPSSTLSSTTFTVTASSAGSLTATATITLSVSAAGALVPTFDSPISTSSGYTVNVTNYNSNYSFAVSTSAGSVTQGTASGSTLPISVTGLSASASATITVNTTRAGYGDGSATVTGSATAAPSISSTTSSVSATVGTAISTTSAFTYSNFASAPTYTISPNPATYGLSFNSATGELSGTPSGSLSATTFTITGTSGGQNATANITISISDAGSLVPTFGSATSTSDGYTVNVTNYDSNYNFAVSVNSGSVTPTSVTTGNTLLTITGLSAGASATITVTTTRSGYGSGTATKLGTALSAPTISSTTSSVTATVGTAITPTNAFTANNFTGSITYTISPDPATYGLSFDPTNGVISGTPTSAFSTTTFTITATSGSQSATSTITLSASAAGSLTPTFSTPNSTSDGFTVNVTNYNGSYTFAVSTNRGTAVAGSPSGTLLPITVSGLSAGVSAAVTVATSRSGYANGSATVTGSAISSTPLTYDPPTPTSPVIPVTPVVPVTPVTPVTPVIPVTPAPKLTTIKIDPNLVPVSVITPVITKPGSGLSNNSLHTPFGSPTTQSFTALSTSKEVITGKPIVVVANTSSGKSLNIKVDAYGYKISGRNWSISTITEKASVGVSTDTLIGTKKNDLLTLTAGQTISSFGSGFKPNTQIDLYVFSSPIKIGTTFADRNGRYKANFVIPMGLALGDHILQAQGKTYDHVNRIVNFPIIVVDKKLVENSNIYTKRFDVFYGLNSYSLSAQSKAKIKSATNSVLARLTEQSRITVTITGWVQPTKINPNAKWLSMNRAKAVESYLKKLGLAGKYVLVAAGSETADSELSRRASVVITWTKP